VDAVIDDVDQYPDIKHVQVFQDGLPRLSKLLPNLRRVFLRPVPWTGDIWLLSEVWEHHFMCTKLRSFDHLRDWGDLSKNLFVPEPC
jgi:hypothetical protein